MKHHVIRGRAAGGASGANVARHASRDGRDALRQFSQYSADLRCVLFVPWFRSVFRRVTGERRKERERKRERGSRRETPQDKSAFFLRRIRRSPSGWRTTITRTAPVTATYPRSSWSSRWVCHARSRIAMRARQTVRNGALEGRERKTEEKGGGCPVRVMGVEQPTGFRLLL